MRDIVYISVPSHRQHLGALRLREVTSSHGMRLNSVGKSYDNPLDLVERDLVARSVIKLRRARRLMRGNRLGIFNRTAILQICGDPGCTKCVAASRGGESGFKVARQASAISSKLADFRASNDSEDMMISTMYDGLVGYIVQEQWDSESQDSSRFPIGTFFFVEHSVGPGAGCAQYIVTCRHVIEGFIRESSPKRMFIRMNSGAHGFAEDFPIGEGDWVFGGDVDVAVVRWAIPPQRQFWAYPVERSQPFGLYPGQNTFFIGMFSGEPGFVSVQPVVRTGNIARVLSEVPLRFKEDPEESVSCAVHLVEMHSWGGESGSPVFFMMSGFLSRRRMRSTLETGLGTNLGQRSWAFYMVNLK
jgi:Trypsin-like peptidase domain